ncbi:hypothetical protein CT19431_MP80398 [Cupriavidus taiwanensis]|nr:hypothetical protein CT19431_MP80398 [Cupriavidus taiwanensis]
MVGRLRLRCARALSQVYCSGTECVAALARVVAGERKGFSLPACFRPSPACLRERGGGEGGSLNEVEPSTALEAETCQRQASGDAFRATTPKPILQNLTATLIQ